MNINKYAFLDLDGVLNHSNWYNNPERIELKYTLGELESDYDPTCISHLNHIIDKVPDVKIVLTSTWRLSTSKDLDKYGNYPEGIITALMNAGLKCNIYGSTPSVQNRRDVEIMDFIYNDSTNPYVFVILDDDDFYSNSVHSEVLAPRFIQTNYFESGLTMENANAVIDLLKWQGE